jgi:LysM repeat protein/bacterioferritin (cytochrome b1)
MSCEVQINTIDLLQKKNIIDDFSRDGRNRILKIIDFEKLNDKYTQLAKIKYPNLSILDGQLLFTIDEIEATDYSRLKYVRDVKYKTAWAVPNKELFDKIQIEFDKSRDPGPKEGEQLSLFMRTDASKPKTRLASTIYEIYPDITEKEIRTIYDNYVNLMGRAREGKQLPFDTFLSLMKTYQVYNYKDTYIFGQWDPKNAVFVTRVNSSPTSKELLAEAIPNLVSKGLDFISFVPKDVADKYARSGYTLSSTGFDYNFKREDMVKYAAISNQEVAYKLFNKRIEDVSQEELEDYNHALPLKYTPLQVDASLINKAGKDASAILQTYLKGFGITVKDISEMKTRVGIDEFGFADILSKVIYTKDKQSLPPLAGEFIAYMMQHNNLIKDIIVELSKTPDYKNLSKSKYFKLIGELISQDLQNKIDRTKSKTLLDLIRDLLMKFFNKAQDVNIELINTNIGIITSNILQQNKKLIATALYKPGAPGKPVSPVNIEDALKKDRFGAQIVADLSSVGMILTGSTALSEQGEILRPDENPLHDLDWVSPFKREETQSIMMSVYPDAIYVREIANETYVTDSYLIAPEGYSIKNYKTKEKVNDDGTVKLLIESYDVVDKDDNVVGTYKNVDGEEIATGVEGKVIDFFSYDDFSTRNKFAPFKYTTNEGVEMQLSNWKDIFNAKLDWARYKDIWDYNRFIPNINVDETNEGLVAFGIPLVDINLDTLKDARSKQVAEVLAKKLSLGLNISFQNITAEKAAEITRVSPTPYNGEPAFYYGGTVYVVGNNVNANTVLHEFSHPVINGIRMKNRKLFDNLYEGLLATTEGKQIRDNVMANYPELASNPDMLKSEILTYGLQMAAVNKLTDKIQTEGFDAVINKILAAIKELIRGIFGNKQGISSINVDTTIDELGRMLLEDEIDMSEYDVTNDDLIQYGKFVTERANELTKAMGSVELEKVINEWYASNKAILDRARNFKTDKAVKEMLTKSIFGEREGSTNLLPEAVSSLRRFQTITDFGKYSKDQLMSKVLDAEEERLKELDRQARALINSIDKIDIIAENMLNDLGKIYKEKNVSARNTIALVNFYKQNSYAWKETIDQFNEIIREGKLDMDKDNLFYKVINKINANLDEINVVISQIYKKNNIQFYVELTGPMNEFVQDEFKKNLNLAFKNAYKSQADRDVAVESFYNKVLLQEDVTDDLEALYKNGVPKDVLSRFLDLYQNMVATPEKIQNALTGHAKDVSWFNRFLESYTSSNDPIVGPLALFIQNQRTEITNDFMDGSGSFLKALEKLLPQVNFTKLNVTQIQDMVTYEDTIMYWDKDTGKPIERKIRTFLHEFGNGYRYAEDILEYNLAEARASKNQEKIIAAREELKQFRKDYMWQEFVPEYYESDKVYDEIIPGYDAATSKRIAMEAYSDRQNALDDYNNLLNEHDDELSRFKNYSSLQAAFRKFKQLSALTYEDGTAKVDDPKKGIYDLSKAKLLQRVSQAKFKFYEFVPLQKSLESAYNEFINNLATDGITREHPEFDKKIKEWRKQNLTMKYDPKYAQRRRDIIDRIGVLQSKMNLSFDTAGAYREINDLIFTYRDELGQPITPELGEEKVKRIQELEQGIINFRESLDRNSGLSQEDRAYLNALTAMVKKGTELSAEQKRQMINLLKRQSQTGLTITEAAELQNLFAELGELSEKIPTDYYLDALNFHLSRLEAGEVTADEVEDFINEDKFQELLEEDEKLRDWFEMNHVTKKRKVDNQTVLIYEPTIANRITVPINKDYIMTTKIVDQETGEPVTLEGVPNARHSRYQVKNEFRTVPIGESWDQYVGTYVDNKGNYLPRLFDPGNKNSAKNARFMNQRFFDLKRSNNAEYKLLEEMKKFHLGVQKGQSNYSKLYLDMPRFAVKAGDLFQAMQRGKIGERFKNFREWKDQLIGKSVNDFERGYNYDAKNNLVNTDLKGNQITYVPVEGIFNIELEKTDADIITGLFKYGMSVKTQGKLLESLPIVESIVSTLEDPANQPKNMDAYSKGIFNVRNLYQNPTKAGAENNRLGQVRSLIQREYLGQQTASFEESNPKLSKWLDIIQGLSARASLAVNIPSDLKNQFSGYIQSMIESIGGEFITSKDYAMAIPWSTQAMLTWASKDAYAVGPGSLSGQMLQRFDPTFTSEDKFGNSISKSLVKDLVNGSWMYAHRKFGEMDVAVKLFGSFLHGQKINQLIGGKQVSIRYVDAFELDNDGLMRLKAGVDAAWDTKSTFHNYIKGESLKQIADRYNITVDELKKRNNIESEIQLEDGQEIIIAKSEKFKAFKNKLQGTSRRLFGAYDRFGQPEGNKFIAYRMFFFMRKWFTPMLTNRWGINSKTASLAGGGERYDWALGRYTKGYYVNAFQTLVRIIKSKGAEMSYMTDQEKADLRRTMAEGMIIIVASLIASMLLGFDPDDDDKWDKIKARSGAINQDSFDTYGFLANHMLLLLLGVQAETSAFVPLPKIFGINLGADDYTKMLTSTSASWYNTVVLYVQIMGDVLNFVTFDDAARYEKDQGPYWWQQEGSLKFWKRMFSVFGFTGGTGDPTTVLKNFQNSSSRYGG